MSEELKCPCCGNTKFEQHIAFSAVGDTDTWYSCEKCPCSIPVGCYEKIDAAMKLAKATRTLEDVTEPLNSGRLKMGQALPAIRLAMEDQNACEQRVLEVFK